VCRSRNCSTHASGNGTGPLLRRIKPNASHLASAGHLNLITRLGPLDILGTIGRDLGYQELIPHSVELAISADLRIRVLDLETLIAVKEELGGEKDRARQYFERLQRDYFPEADYLPSFLMAFDVRKLLII